MTSKEYYKSTRMVETRNWTLEMALNFAEEYAEALRKHAVSNSLPDFRDVINARIDYFKSIHHTYEAADLQNALNTTIRLVPPINFQIGQ